MTPAPSDFCNDGVNNIGTCHQMAGKFEASEKCFNRAKAIIEKNLGAKHADLTPVLNNLAELYSHQSKYDRAEKLFKRVLAIKEGTHGPKSLQVALTLNNFAMNYLNQGKFKKAEPHLKRSLKICEKNLGSAHNIVMKIKQDLIEVYTQTGRREKATELHKQINKTVNEGY